MGSKCRNGASAACLPPTEHPRWLFPWYGFLQRQSLAPSAEPQMVGDQGQAAPPQRATGFAAAKTGNYWRKCLPKP